MEVQRKDTDGEQKEKTCITKSWESECGTVTVTTCKWVSEDNAAFVKRHREKVEEMMRLCPPISK